MSEIHNYTVKSLSELCDKFEHLDFNPWALQKSFTDPKTGQSLQVDGFSSEINSIESL